MNIHKVQFIKSATHIEQKPSPSLPEVAVVGRSNVGKSSLINTLFNRKNLAKISSTPGKTRLLNYFQIDEHIYFVDLPGYGYAKLSKQEREKWQKNIESYLKNNKYLELVLLLIDIRHGILPIDQVMIEWLIYYKISFAIILTKSDKISKNHIKSVKMQINNQLPIIDVFTFSALKKTGREEIIALIERIADDNSDNLDRLEH